MEIYLLLLKLILLDKMCGGLPAKILEHYVINNTMLLSWWMGKQLFNCASNAITAPFKYVADSNKCTGIKKCTNNLCKDAYTHKKTDSATHIVTQPYITEFNPDTGINVDKLIQEPPQDIIIEIPEQNNPELYQQPIVLKEIAKNNVANNWELVGCDLTNAHEWEIVD